MDAAKYYPNHSIDVRKATSIAKWGAACAPCATAKAKCIRSNSAVGSKCDRCDRLFKDCNDQVHRPRKKRQSRPSRTAQIEERLNGLVSLLRASGEIPALSADLSADTTCIPTETDPAISSQHKPSVSTARSGSFARSSGPSGLRSSSSPGLDSTNFAIPESYNSYAPPTCICRPESGDAPPPPESDETLLSIFQNELTPVYPFVVIPRNVSAAHLKASRPFLMSAIRMVASFRSMKSMRAQMYQIMRHLADHMLLRSERSLDLLMGIVVVLGWYHYHCFMHAQMNNLLSLASSLVGELGLTHHPRLAERTRLMVLSPEEPRHRTNEERRLLLGVWYLISSTSVTFQKLDAMRYTAYMQQCSRELDQAREYDSDTLLTTLVRLQHLMDRVARLHAPDELADEAGAGVPRAPVAAYTSAFQSELDKIRANLPKSLRTNKLLHCHMNSITLRLYEPPVLDAALLTSLANSLASLGPGTSSALDIFYQSNAALKTWFDNWLSIPVSTYYSMPQPTFSQLIWAITMLGRWAKYAAPYAAPLPPSRQQQQQQQQQQQSSHNHLGHYSQHPNSAFSNFGGTLGAQPRQRTSLHSLVDPSSHNPNVALAAADAAMNPSTPSGSSTTAVSVVSSSSAAATATAATSSSSSPLFVLREGTDPGLPAAVAALKARLATQPGLMLDIPEILAAVAARAEEANAAMVEAAVEPGAWDNNIWGLGITKVKITIAKLERFAEIVAARGMLAAAVAGGDGGGSSEGGSESGMEDEDEGDEDEDAEMQGGDPLAGAGGALGSVNASAVNAWQSQAAAAVAAASFSDLCSTPWSNDLFDGIDPSVWLDGSGDWGSIVLSSMGNM